MQGINPIVIKACHGGVFVVCWGSMKKIHVPCLFAVLSLLFSGALAYAGDYDGYQEVKKAVEGYAKAFGASDVECVSRYLAEGHVHVNPFGAELTKEELLEDMSNGTLHFDFYDLESLEFIPLSLACCLAKGIVHARAHRDGHEMSVRFRFVHIMKNQNFPSSPSQWQSIYTQHTKILDSDTACEGEAIVADF